MGQTGRLAVALVAILSAHSAAEATQVRTMDLHELVGASTAVVRGSVLSQQPVWDARRQRIYTDSIVLVDEWIIGRSTTLAITVRQLGGAIGGVRHAVDGVGSLEAGMQVLLFVQTDGVRHYVTGMAQGSYAVTTRGPHKWVHRDLRGLRLVRLGARGQKLGRAQPGRLEPGIRYDALVSTIRAYGRAAEGDR